MSRLVTLFVGFLLTGAALAKDQPAGASAPVRIVATVEGQKGAAPPELTPDDVMVFQNDQRLRVTGWQPINRVGLQIWLLIDDGTDTSLGLQLGDLRSFVLEQSAATRVGIGYLRNGSVQVLQDLTTDHKRAADAFRLLVGTPGISASPYLALIDLIHKWPATEQAREVLMVTSGIDPIYGPGPDNPYLLRAIDAAQRAGVIVHSIYFGSAGHFGHSLWQINWGQNYLAQLAEETGGEFFWLGNSNPVSFAPYLKDLNQRLRSQYQLTFLAKSQGKPAFQSIKFKTEVVA